MASYTVAFQGEPGAYSEQAAIEFHPFPIATLPCPAFEDVFYTVSSRAAESSIIPVENSLAGSIHRNYDLMLRHELHITGEYYLRVSHCLMALPGVHLEDIRRVHSHPQALAQCEANLKKLSLEMVPEADTAGSARLLIQNQDLKAGVLASRQAAQVYGLQILVENMEDNSENYTRFLILSGKPIQVEGADNSSFKTSVVFTLENKPGALFKALSVFALRDIDLTKIESRPVQGHPWEYLFYIDFAGSASSQICRRALDHLAELAPFLRLLGSYPRHEYQQ